MSWNIIQHKEHDTENWPNEWVWDDKRSASGNARQQEIVVSTKDDNNYVVWIREEEKYLLFLIISIPFKTYRKLGHMSSNFHLDFFPKK